jgi:circadian clock protein KaiB
MGCKMKYLLKLYVYGKTFNSQKAIDNLKNILSEPSLEGKFELEIIDILEHPQLAEDEKIIATPVLKKKLPPPLREIIGDLNDKEKVLLGLDLVTLEEEMIK